MFTISNFTENDDVQMLDALGAFQVIEWKRDLSVTPESAATAYFSSEMNVRRRQVICDLSQAPITIQAGAMQWMVGDVEQTTGVTGVGDFLGKAVRGAVTKESAIKPEYKGTGKVILEPTYKYILLIDVANWGNSIVLDDGLFLACYSSLQHQAVMRSNVSSAVAGNEGLFIRWYLFRSFRFTFKMAAESSTIHDLDKRKRGRTAAGRSRQGLCGRTKTLRHLFF